MIDRFFALGYKLQVTEDEGVWGRDALMRVDDLRRELDVVRGQKPWPH